MNRRSLLRRYLPLAGLIAVQLLIVLVVPSVAPGSGDLAVSAGNQGQAVTQYTGPAAGADAGVAATAAQGAAPVAGSSVSSGESAGGGEAGPAGGGGGEAAAGDTSHCVDGRQFDPEQFPFAPPCVPKFAGDNGGATTRGVTGDKITIVRYDSQSDPAVDALLESVDLGSSDEQEDELREAAQEFINSHYETYGRTVELVDFKGNCDLLPPVPDCFRDDMRTLINTHNPFYVFWRTTLSSASFDELSKNGVLNAGGQHFSENFGSSRRPYHYDQMMTGTKIADYFSEYWCKRLAPYPVKYGAGLHPTEPGQMNGSQRVLGIITQDDPGNTEVLNEIKERVKNCGGGVKAVYQYAQDIDRAQEQRKAGLAKMREAGVTFLTCICDAIAPYFMIITEDEDRYWPENFLAGTGYMDHDFVGRLYDVSTTWERSWGISTLPVLENLSADDAARVWKATGRSGNPPYTAAVADWAYYQMVAEAIHLAGPDLNPQTFEQGSFATARASAGPTLPGLSFGPSNHGWIDDVKEVYWSKTARSNVDGRPGAYEVMNGGVRFTLGSIPDTEFTRPGTGG